jgi:putative membrane protein
MDMPRAPRVIEHDEPHPLGPAEAPPVPDADLPAPRAMRAAAALVARRGSALGRWFWRAAAVLVAFLAGVAVWDTVAALFTRHPALGTAAGALFALVGLFALALALREGAALARLERVDRLKRAAGDARVAADLRGARAVVAELGRLYAGRPELAAGRVELDRRAAEQMDAAALFELAETHLLAPLDAAAEREIAAAARTVAAATALVPLALADVLAALVANLRMIRRIAEIYGGRAGTIGAWRLLRMVMTHLLATGAVAAGDDLIGSMAGGGVLAKLSRRFGEGVVNGALTARVGVAALEVCRPLPFHARPRPRVSQLVTRALAGLFGRGD